MIRTVLVAAGLAVGMTAVLAQADPIAARRDAMKAVGAATRDGAAIAKEQTPFDAAKAQAIFKVYADAAKAMPEFYPETAKMGGETTASPKIWEDKAGFQAAFARFGEAAAKGAAVTDLASFRTAFGEATKNCSSCHETYRIKR